MRAATNLFIGACWKVKTMARPKLMLQMTVLCPFGLILSMCTTQPRRSKAGRRCRARFGRKICMAAYLFAVTVVVICLALRVLTKSMSPAGDPRFLLLSRVSEVFSLVSSRSCKMTMWSGGEMIDTNCRLLLLEQLLCNVA